MNNSVAGSGEDNRQLEDQLLGWLTGHEKYSWSPDDLLELVARADVHYHRQMQQLDSSDVPEHKVRGIIEYSNLVKTYSPSYGSLSRISKRTKAYKKGYKRSQKEGYQQQTEQEISEFKDRLNSTLDWSLDPELTRLINQRLDIERELWKQKKAEIEENARRWKAQAGKDEIIGQQIREAVEKTGGYTYGWDLAQVGTIFYQPIKNRKITYNDVPAALQTAAIIRDLAGDVLPDSGEELIKSAIIITGEGHGKMMSNIQKALMIGSDLFKASRFDQVKLQFEKAGLIAKNQGR